MLRHRADPHMPLPTEETAYTIDRAAVHTLLRFFALVLAFGYVDVVAALSTHVIVTTIEPGGRPPIVYMSTLASGATWTYAMTAVTLLGWCIKAAMLAWAIRHRARPIERPWIIFAVGLGGLIASVLAFGVHTVSMMVLVRTTESERIAVRAIAMTTAGQAGVMCDWAMSFGMLLALLVLAVKKPPDTRRAGPYREPSA